MSATARAGGGWVSAAVPVRTADVTATNVYGAFRTPVPGGLSVLLTAHFDGVGDDPDGTRFPAAADNASGVAVVIEAARQLHQSLPAEVGLAVALLDGEEAGAHGSARHAPQTPAGTYVINVDGAAALDQAAAVEAGGPAHRLLAALDQAGRATGVPLRAAAMPSDNRRYATAGLPAIGIGMGLPGYQTPAETADRVQPATLDAAVRLVVATVNRLAAMPDRATGSDSKEYAMSTPSALLPVAVIGAGPVGLAAAAQLASRGRDFVVVEAGDSIASSVADWAHVRLFSPWRFNTDAAARTLLEATGWHPPDPSVLPTGGELIADYLVPLAAHPAISPRLRLGVSVTAIARHGVDRVRTAGRDRTPFLLRLSDGSEILASAVIDASGTWRTPNPIGGYGIPAHGEAQARRARRIFDGMPDVTGALRNVFAGKAVAVVGAGHSATGTVLALAELADTTIHWLVRAPNADRAYGGGDADALPARGAIGAGVQALVAAGTVTVHTGFFVHEVTDQGLVSADGRKVDAEVIVNATGARPDHTLAGELRLDLDPVLGSTRALAPLIDPNLHSCGTVPPHGVDELAHPEPGFYIVGAKSYGRAPTFLLATGYEQVRSVVAALAGDWAAARDVRLELPETGVCSTSLPVDVEDSAGAGGRGAPAVAEPARGLATGVGGGLLTLPLVEVAAADGSSTGCCG